MKLMHKRTCHTGRQVFENMVRLNAADGIEELRAQKVDYDVCNECCVRKSVSVPHPRKEKKKRKVLEVVHTDVVGPVSPASRNSDKYLSTLLDEASRGVWVELMKERSRVSQLLQKLIEEAENGSGQKVKNVRSDRAKEYMADALEMYYSKRGISHQETPPYSPESNGGAERLNKSIFENSRAILEELHVLSGSEFYKTL